MIYIDPNFLDIRAYLIAYLITSFFGLCIGSFLNVCIYRLPRHESLIKRNSHCTTCQEKIRFYDLVPVFSWLFLRGKCRKCGSKISGRYPLVESLNWFSYLLVLTFTDCFSNPVQSVLTALFSSVLIVIAFIDYDTMEIYTNQLVLIIIIGVLSLVFSGMTDAEPVTLKDRIIGMLCVGLPFFLIGEISAVFVKKITGERTRGIELGDTLLMTCSGFFIGTKPVIASAFAGILAGAVIGSVLKFVLKKDSKMPFGPFLSAGLLIGTIWGKDFINWYLSLFTYPSV